MSDRKNDHKKPFSEYDFRTRLRYKKIVKKGVIPEDLIGTDDEKTKLAKGEDACVSHDEIPDRGKSSPDKAGDEESDDIGVTMDKERQNE